MANYTKRSTSKPAAKKGGDVKKEYTYENMAFGEVLDIAGQAAHEGDGLTVRVQGKLDGERVSLIFIDQKSQRSFSCSLKNYTEDGILKLWASINQDNVEGAKDGYHAFQERKEVNG